MIAWTPVDDRHRRTDACRHLVADEAMGVAAALAICEGDAGFYLFGCDSAWMPITDTWHATLDEAKRQAEFEYEGVQRSWQSSNPVGSARRSAVKRCAGR